MAKGVFSRTVFETARAKYTEPGKSATDRGEQHVRETGKLNPLVDPAEFGVVRESRMRFTPKGGTSLLEVANGTPVPIEYRLDTTGSMGDNVQRAIKVLPEICGLASMALPDRDPFYCASMFGDVTDRFVLCRGQFEAEAHKMVDQLTLMTPQGAGGDSPEDPHYGFFGAAYLTNAYLQRIGLRSYDFTITDAPVHDRLAVSQLKRVFGPEVFEKAKANGHKIDRNDLPSNPELVKDMLRRAHGFCLLVADRSDSYTKRHWQSIFGKDRVVDLPKIEYVPHVMATIIGLTEGTFDLRGSIAFLTGNNLSKSVAKTIVDAVAHIPLGAQRALPNFGRMPVKGDLFKDKTDLWPVDPKDIPVGDTIVDSSAKPDDSGGWL